MKRMLQSMCLSMLSFLIMLHFPYNIAADNWGTMGDDGVVYWDNENIPGLQAFAILLEDDWGHTLLDTVYGEYANSFTVWNYLYATDQGVEGEKYHVSVKACANSPENYEGCEVISGYEGLHSYVYSASQTQQVWLQQNIPEGGTIEVYGLKGTEKVYDSNNRFPKNMSIVISATPAPGYVLDYIIDADYPSVQIRPFDGSFGIILQYDKSYIACFKQFTPQISFLDTVSYKGTTPYVIYNSNSFTPAVTVTDVLNGEIIPPENYDVTYVNNTNPGTGKVNVNFKGNYSGTASATFKIYLPATTDTSIENTSEGIHLSWAPVAGAKGYVIYRRAWNLKSEGWTTFERWNNTTGTEWTDTTVYAGTRYQYGIKAYYSNPMDNYNLGEVGPLKTTVRITTRTLYSVTPGTKQMTVKWTPSKVFTGYQIKYATDAAFTKNVKAVKITDPAKSSEVIKNMTSGKTYYVTIRSYQVFEGMTYFGEWSNVKSVKIK